MLYDNQNTVMTYEELMHSLWPKADPNHIYIY